MKYARSSQSNNIFHQAQREQMKEKMIVAHVILLTAAAALWYVMNYVIVN